MFEYTISKVIPCASLSHRIDGQQLDSDFTENGMCDLKCRRWHGHNADIIITLSAEKLHNNMVMDFNELGFVKSDLVNKYLDHHNLIYINDPLFDILVRKPFEEIAGQPLELEKVDKFCADRDTLSIIKIPESLQDDNVVGAWFKAQTVVSFSTSSENICRWLYFVISDRIHEYNKKHDTHVRLNSVSYKETDNSCSTFGWKNY